MELKPWQRKYQCQVCRDVIYSHYEGDYAQCYGGHIAVDQTSHYERRIGDPSHFILLIEEQQDESTRREFDSQSETG